MKWSCCRTSVFSKAWVSKLWSLEHLAWKYINPTEKHGSSRASACHSKLPSTTVPCCTSKVQCLCFWKAGLCSVGTHGMEGRQEVQAGCRAATVAQPEQQWCQTSDPSNLLRKAGSDSSQHQWEKVGNYLQRWQMGVCFAISFEGLGFLPEQSTCTQICVGWGVCALGLRGFGSRKERSVFVLWFHNAPNVEVNSVNNRKIQGSTPNFLNLSLSVSLIGKNGWCSSFHCFFPLLPPTHRGYCCLFSIQLKHSIDSAYWSYCPSSVPPACKQSSALGYGSGREYSASSWSPGFQLTTFTITSRITVNTVLNVSFNYAQNLMGFISNFPLLVTTLLKLLYAGKKKKRERAGPKMFKNLTLWWSTKIFLFHQSKGYGLKHLNTLDFCTQ